MSKRPATSIEFGAALLAALGIPVEDWVVDITIRVPAHEPVIVEITRIVKDDEMQGVIEALQRYELVPKEGAA